uniref:WD40 domain-containing protein n=1 Tax=Trepomonas sp. PC1 TaxID=1076344 RepID=A0A146KKM4_9EUKA|eukprot:JAP95971.1 WD40 domain-containing protein [Trepomonas sp. PC1]
MTLQLQQQIGLSFTSQPYATTNQFSAQAAGRSLVVITTDGQQRIFPGHSKYIQCVATSPDCKLIISAQSDCLCLWTYATGQVQTLALPDYPIHLAFSLDSKFFTVCFQQGFVECYDTQLNRIGTFSQLKQKQTLHFSSWFQVQNTSGFILSDHNRLIICSLAFDRATLTQKLISFDILLPATGIDREFFCGTVVGSFAYCGTMNGELAVFDIDKKSFLGLVKYFQAKMQDILSLESNLLLISQNGDIAAVSGQGTKFLLSSEAKLDAKVVASTLQAQNLHLVLQNGSVVQLKLKSIVTGQYKAVHPTFADVNRQGNVGMLPGQDGFLNVKPQGYKQIQQSAELNQQSFQIETSSLQVRQTFPSSVLVNSVCFKDTLISQTENGYLQAWGASLTAQFKIGGQACGICANSAYIFAAFDQTVYMLAFSDQKFILVQKMPLSQISCVGCSETMLAVGCQDGKVFIINLQQFTITNRITDFGQKVSAIAFDKLVQSIIHVANVNQLTTYDLKSEPRKLKNRFFKAQITALQQLESGRFELIAACLDGTINFLDFDIADPVQTTKLPPGCLVGKKLFLSLCGNKLVAGGCYLDADEVLLTMACQKESWEPVGSFLSNGVVISSICCSQDRVWVTGMGGEVAVYGW